MDASQKRMMLMAAQKRQRLMDMQASMGQPEPDKVNDQMPEWLNPDDRSVVKNLSNSDGESLKYLQSKYPDAEFKQSGSDILVRKKGEQAYGKLDPSFSPLSNPMGTLKDLWNDTKDLGYDAVQGVAEGAGALAGAPGGLPGVMAGSAGGAGAASFLKEKLREKYGLTDKADMGNVLTDMAVGGALPGVMNVAGKGVKALAKTATPKAYGWLVGRSPEQLKRLADKGDDLANMSSDEALAGVEGLRKSFGDDVAKRLDAEGARYAAAEADGGLVNTIPIVESIDNEIAKLQQLVKENPYSGTLKQELNDAIKYRIKEIGPMGLKPKKMKLDAASKLRNALSDSYLPAYKDDIGQMVGKGVSSTEEKFANIMRRGLKEQQNIATGGQIGSIDSDYVKLNSIAKFGREYLDTPKKIISTIDKLTEGKDDVLLGKFQRLPQELQEQILGLQKDRDLYNYLKGINKKRVITDENVGTAAANALVGRSPIEKFLTLAGGAAGTASGAGYPGMAAGLAIGRGVGKVIASPKNVLRASKFGDKVGTKMNNLEELLKKNPELQSIIYGAANSVNN